MNKENLLPNDKRNDIFIAGGEAIEYQ